MAVRFNAVALGRMKPSLRLVPQARSTRASLLAEAQIQRAQLVVPTTGLPPSPAAAASRSMSEAFAGE